MKNLSRELKLLAISEEVPIIAISSATPDDVTDMNSVPTLGQTSWSRQIAYDADFLLALGRAANSDVIQAVFRKNRNGFLGEFMVQVDFDRGIFKYVDFE
jgi:replicative DNA helicase